MKRAKITGYQLAFENELSLVVDATAITRIRVSAGASVNHRIRGYYERPWSSTDIAVGFNCTHPTNGVASYQNGDGQPMRRWEGELHVDGPVRLKSAAEVFRELVVTAPPAPVGAVIECTFEVKKRWSRELEAWVPVPPRPVGHLHTDVQSRAIDRASSMHLSVGAFPFLMSLIAILIQPALDMVWMARFEELYRARDQGLVGAAKWIADVSAFLPTALLTVFGAFFILDTTTRGDQRSWFLFAACAAGVATAGVYLRAVYKRDPERKTQGHYSGLQYWLMLLNVAGAVTACVLG